jgi:hypothetical protein
MPIASKDRLPAVALAVVLALLSGGGAAFATPANKAAMVKHFGTFLPPAMNSCTACHLPSEIKHPETLAEFPHNAFGTRLRELGEAAKKAGGKLDIPHRIQQIAAEDADGDGVANEIEFLLGHNAGDKADAPTAGEIADGGAKVADFARVLSAYRWQPFEPVRQPPIPQTIANPVFPIRNPIDAFIAKEHSNHGLTPRPEAAKLILLRRVHLDLTGLSPTPEEIRAFLSDDAPGAYERVVDRLLESPAHGERWARHWMDVWRYSDWTGYQGVPRDSMPHIWRWRDWIIESLNEDKGYDRMVLEMLAADELAPTDDKALRATGFLARNFKANFREKTMEDMIGHTFQAFQGITMNCAKCHDHMYDPISQREYYEVRAIFEPHGFRTDRVPGQTNTDKNGDGLVRAFDNALAAKTFIFARGDERKPLKEELIQANLPRIFGAKFDPHPITLPPLAARPDKRDFVIREDIARAESLLQEARQLAADLRAGKPLPDAKKLGGKAAKIAANANSKLPPALQELPPPGNLEEAERNAALSEARVAAFKATIAAEQLEHDKQSSAWESAAKAAVSAQRQAAVLESRFAIATATAEVKAAQARADKDAKGGDKGVAKKSGAALAAAQKELTAAEKALAKAEKELTLPVDTAYEPRKGLSLPETSTGRRAELARWFSSRDNPLTARVAVNHIWARHFGRGIVSTLNEFGRNGLPPSHPQLLDWLAAELMNRGWSMKEMHRLIVTSSTYRMASTPDIANAAKDRDNAYLWRMNSKRMEAEVVRDNILHAAGSLDPAMGGPDIDHLEGLTSKRRSVYLRSAPEKQVEFLNIFDGPNPVECYQRPTTVMPHQALALANSELTIGYAKLLASQHPGADDSAFLQASFERILARPPSDDETRLCLDFLREQYAMHSSSKDSFINTALQQARQNLVVVLFNHNDFITIR